ncbi:alpha-amylase [Streptomyces alboflavus]|uniref:Alpha-amylase n=1 Tax=Streptomyces alboflavus TaxID=67267 RepID=A0A1Z1WLF9_9ACTN|nr:alpha-amylase [Streptomyces alboflavus]
MDIVPNHMAAVPRHNRALWEVLREGPDSPYARWFDIDWEAGDGKVLLPVLGRRLGRELEHLRVEGGVLRHHDQEFPLRAGTEGLPLPRLLDAQWYRLAWWRLARTEINYRRFFTISDLIAVRVEDPEVFDATHATVLQLLAEGVVDGLRVDHPDGLADPGAYLQRLHEATGGRWTAVEKILPTGSRCPPPGRSRAPRATTRCGTSTGSSRTRRAPPNSSPATARSRRRPPTAAGTGRRRCGAPRTRSFTRELAAEVDRLTRGRRRCARRIPRCATTRRGRCGRRCGNSSYVLRSTVRTPPGAPIPRRS